MYNPPPISNAIPTMKNSISLPPLRRRFVLLALALACFALSPDARAGRQLFVGNLNANSVEDYDGTTGVFIETFVPSGSGGLSSPQNLTFGPDGNLYVTSHDTNSVKRYDGETGAFIDDFVPSGSGGLSAPTN